jgi:hypothetical protein
LRKTSTTFQSPNTIGYNEENCEPATRKQLNKINSRLADIRSAVANKREYKSNSALRANRHKIPIITQGGIPKCYKYLFNQRTTLKLTKYNPLESMDRIKRQAHSRGTDALDVLLENLEKDRTNPKERPKLRSVMENYIPKTNFFKEYQLEQTEEYGKYISKIENSSDSAIKKKKASKVTNSDKLKPDGQLNALNSGPVEKDRIPIYRIYAKQMKMSRMQEMISQNIEEKLEKQIRPYIRRIKKRYFSLKENKSSCGMIAENQYDVYLNNTIDYHSSMMQKNAFPRICKNIRRKVIGEMRLLKEPEVNAKKLYNQSLASKINSKIISNTQHAEEETSNVISILESGQKPSFLKNMIILDKRISQPLRRSRSFCNS